MSTIYKTEAGGREVRRRYREALAAWPVPAEHLRVPTREGETFVVVSGPRDAPPVVLLHGSGSNSQIWTGDVAAWSRHSRVHAVDLVGEPGLSAPSRPPLDGGALALWLEDVLDGLGLDETALVGTSHARLPRHRPAHAPVRPPRDRDAPARHRAFDPRPDRDRLGLPARRGDRRCLT
jgi:hypothetical protein